MTNSESIYQFGNNAYAKPATALNILRETVLGRELFDYAFKEYAQRWKFKHPSPADFFRTMEDASAVDLDWFWRGWFYTNDHVDISLDEVQWFQLDTKNPDIEKPLAKSNAENRFIGDTRNKEDIKETVTERLPNMNDFYNEYDPYEVTILDRQQYERYLAGLSDEEKKVLESGQNFYQLKFSNKGGLVTPVIMEFTYTDGTTEVIRIPAELWKLNSDGVTKVFKTEKEIASIELDPFLETADTDLSNNHWPPKPQPTRFELFKQRQRQGGQNPMQRDRMIKKMEEEKSKSGKK